MRATFYEALEVPSTSDTPSLRSALRSILRRFWSVPRDPSGDTEEAVRFVALGAAILTDDRRREQYDASARRGATTNPWRVGNDGVPLAGADVGAMGLPGSHGGDSAQISIANGEPTLLPAVHALTDPLPEHTLWAASLAYAMAAIAMGLGVAFAYFGASASLSGGAAAAVAVVALIAGALVASQLTIVSSELSGFSLARLAVTKWRREASVFVGNPPPQQDTAWIFRLRVMELTRSAAGYSSAPHVLHRTLARLADYAVIAGALLTVFWIFEALFPASTAVVKWLRSPLVLPALSVLVFIPVEIICTAQARTTFGKFLLGVVVVTGVTEPDDRAALEGSRFSAARALAFARSAAFFGIWPVALVRLGKTLRTLRVGEASWEAAGDSVTLVRPAPFLMRTSGAALALSAIVGCAFLWASDFRAAYDALTARLTTSVSAVKTSAQEAMSTASKSAKEAVASATLPVPTASTSAPAPTPDVNPPASAATPSATATKVRESGAANETVTANEFEKQTSLAQARRARIDNAEKKSAAARATGSYAGLQGVCERWTQDQPGSAEAWRCLGLAKFQSGAGRDALPALRQALKLDANDAQVEAAIFKILRP